MMWKEKYSIGVETIDEQHKELFKNLGEFIKLVQNKEIKWEDRLNKAKETLEFLKGMSSSILKMRKNTRKV